MNPNRARNCIEKGSINSTITTTFRSHLTTLATRAQGPHPFPSRTRPLSPAAPMVLRPRGRGRVGRRRLLLERPLIVSQRSGVFSFGERATGTREQGKCRRGKGNGCKRTGIREQSRVVPRDLVPDPCPQSRRCTFPVPDSPFPVPEAFFRHASRGNRQRRRKAERR